MDVEEHETRSLCPDLGERGFTGCRLARRMAAVSEHCGNDLATARVVVDH
jgi:hypothetical protein